MSVDHVLCTGYAECQRSAGAAFEMNEDNLSVPSDSAPTTDLELLLRAARQCPMNAITVADESGTVLFASAS